MGDFMKCSKCESQLEVAIEQTFIKKALIKDRVIIEETEETGIIDKTPTFNAELTKDIPERKVELEISCSKCKTRFYQLEINGEWTEELGLLKLPNFSEEALKRYATSGGYYGGQYGPYYTPPPIKEFTLVLKPRPESAVVGTPLVDFPAEDEEDCVYGL